MRSPARWRNALLPLVLGSVGIALLAIVFAATEETIIRKEDEEKLKTVNQILPTDLYDNRVLRDSIKIQPDKLLGTGEVTLVYRARRAGQPVAVLLESVAPNGYGGKIRLLLAIRENGELLGVRVLAHNETIGWGDYIEAHKSPWINIFRDASLNRYSEQRWQVKKDGGAFDYVARATISARAIVAAVRRALKYYEAHRNSLYVAS